MCISLIGNSSPHKTCFDRRQKTEGPLSSEINQIWPICRQTNKDKIQLTQGSQLRNQEGKMKGGPWTPSDHIDNIFM